MGKFCTGCGSQLFPGSSFCTSCGKKVDSSNMSMNPPDPTDPRYSYAQQFINPTNGKKTKRKKPLWLKPVISILVTAIIVIPVGYGIWQAGEITGFWNNRALNKAYSKWEKQPDIKNEEQEIFEVLNLFKTALSVNDFERAMSYVHPMSKDEIFKIFTDYQDKIPEFTAALDTLELVYLSENQGYFDAGRSARVMAGIPSNTKPVTGVSYIYLIKTENGWVVEKIL